MYARRDTESYSLHSAFSFHWVTGKLQCMYTMENHGAIKNKLTSCLCMDLDKSLKLNSAMCKLQKHMHGVILLM